MYLQMIDYYFDFIRISWLIKFEKMFKANMSNFEYQFIIIFPIQYIEIYKIFSEISLN